MSHTVIFILLFLVSIVINVSLSQRMNQQTHATQILEAGDDDATKIATLEFILVSTFDAISSRGWWWCQQNISIKFYQVYCVLLCVACYVCHCGRSCLGARVSCQSHYMTSSGPPVASLIRCLMSVWLHGWSKSLMTLNFWKAKTCFGPFQHYVTCWPHF